MRWSRPNTKRLRWHRAIRTGVSAATHRVCAFTGPGPPSRPRAMASLKAQRLLPIVTSKSIKPIKYQINQISQILYDALSCCPAVLLLCTRHSRSPSRSLRPTGGPGPAIAGRFESATLLLRLSAHPTPPAAQICSAASRSECARRRAPSCCSVRSTVARPVAHCHFPCCWTHARQAQRVAVIPRALLLFRLLLAGRLDR